ncbi:hypothetical protein BGZ76_001667 [Entomortierella beljakovae]|nr:hypothetical protein BGZ76_001667 [Entomortierella beljakovae]
MYRRRIKKPPTPAFPDSLQEMGFTINDDGALIDSSGNQYVFDLKAKDRAYQEAHSRALGDATLRIMNKRLEDEFGFTRIKLPLGLEENDTTSPQADIMLSPDAKECKRLLVLIPGTMEPASQPYSTLQIGSVYHVVEKAREQGYGVIVLNPNCHWWVNGRPTNAVGYIQSEPVDKGKVDRQEHAGCNCVNAGEQDFDYTLVSELPNIFKFFNARKNRDNKFENFKDVLQPLNEDDPTTVMVMFEDSNVQDEKNGEFLSY